MSYVEPKIIGMAKTAFLMKIYRYDQKDPKPIFSSCAFSSFFSCCACIFFHASRRFRCFSSSSAVRGPADGSSFRAASCAIVSPLPAASGGAGLAPASVVNSAPAKD